MADRTPPTAPPTAPPHGTTHEQAIEHVEQALDRSARNNEGWEVSA